MAKAKNTKTAAKAAAEQEEVKPETVEAAETAEESEAEKTVDTPEKPVNETETEEPQPETSAEEKPEEEPKGTKSPAYPAFLEQYVKAYPAERTFHVTADRQVFLDKDYSLAKMHQNSLGKGELETYNL